MKASLRKARSASRVTSPISKGPTEVPNSTSGMLGHATKTSPLRT